MRNKFIIIITLFAVSLFVFSEQMVYIYKKDGTKDIYVANTLDSIGFVTTLNEENGHKWVDLGLPSGTKWATMNVGADSPEDYGDYFAWGETTTKSEYTCREYKYYNIQCTAIYKYCAIASCFNDQEDNNTVLDLEDDVASANWGSDWRMPTKVEQEELSNTSYTVWTWITQNGVNGYKVTSKINGNSIFLPAAGSSGSYGAGSIGLYWSSSLYTGTDKYAYERSFNAYYLYFNSSGVYNYSHSRYVGLSIRPVLAE